MREPLTEQQRIYEGGFFCPVSLRTQRPELEMLFADRNECLRFVRRYRDAHVVGYVTYTVEIPPLRGRKHKENTRV